MRLKLDEARATSTPPSTISQRMSTRRMTSLSGDGLILPAGAEDRERGADHLQSALCDILDERAVLDLVEDLSANGARDRRRRLLELRDESVSHDWLWQLCAAHGPVAPRKDFQTAVRLRVGADCFTSGSPCARCGTEMDASATHAFCCALPEATRGHYDVRDALLPLAHLPDPIHQHRR